MKLVFFYDGLCHLCSREMRHFANVAGAREQIEFVDYTDPGFNAVAEGLDRPALDRLMHVRTPDGQVRIGVDALVEIWQRVPGFGWLAWLASRRGLSLGFRMGYFCFARVRPLLPRRKQSCPLNLPGATGKN